MLNLTFTSGLEEQIADLLWDSLKKDPEHQDRRQTSTLDNVVEWLRDLRTQVPKEFREDIRVHVESHGEYEDGHSASIHVYYNRPETDEELAARKKLEENRIKNAQAYELSELARLKQKYGQ